LIVTARNAARFEGLGADEEILSYLPMAWVGDHIFSYAQAIITGFAINCPESAATVLHDLKEIAPTYFFGRRASGELLTGVMVRVEDAVWVSARRCSCSCVSRRTSSAGGSRQPVALWQRLLYPLGNLLVYGPLKDNSAFDACAGYTAGEAIGPEIFLFFRGLGSTSSSSTA